MSPRSASAAAIAAGSTPAPRSASRRAPIRRAHRPSISSSGSAPIAASRPSAIGRSKWLPSLGRSAGARLTVIRLGGSARPARPAPPAPARGLAHRLVGQADDGEGRHAGGERALHLDRARLDALECHRVGPRDHFVLPFPRVATWLTRGGLGKVNVRLKRGTQGRLGRGQHTRAAWPPRVIGPRKLRGRRGGRSGAEPVPRPRSGWKAWPAQRPVGLAGRRYPRVALRPLRKPCPGAYPGQGPLGRSSA